MFNPAARKESNELAQKGNLLYYFLSVDTA
jgi:hypothetical protein